MLAGFGAVAPVVEPAQLGQAVIAGFAREVIQGVAQEVDVAALPARLGQRLGQGAFVPGRDGRR